MDFSKITSLLNLQTTHQYIHSLVGGLKEREGVVDSSLSDANKERRLRDRIDQMSEKEAAELLDKLKSDG